jgi:DNA replication licensing factor MCM4
LNKSKTIIENIQLPPTLLSRFDLIFLLLDPQDEAYDRRLAQHLASWYQYGKEGESAHEAMVNVHLVLFYLRRRRRSFVCFRMLIYFEIIFHMHVHLLVHN